MWRVCGRPLKVFLDQDVKDSSNASLSRSFLESPFRIGKRHAICATPLDFVNECPNVWITLTWLMGASFSFVCIHLFVSSRLRLNYRSLKFQGNLFSCRVAIFHFLLFSSRESFRKELSVSFSVGLKIGWETTSMNSSYALSNVLAIQVIQIRLGRARRFLLQFSKSFDGMSYMFQADKHPVSMR